MTMQQQPNSFRTGPDEQGRFGLYGGRFVAETLMPLILELEQAYDAAKNDPAFKAEMDGYLEELCRPPLPALFRRAAHGALSQDGLRPMARRSTSSARTSITPAPTR